MMDVYEGYLKNGTYIERENQKKLMKVYKDFIIIDNIKNAKRERIDTEMSDH